MHIFQKIWATYITTKFYKVINYNAFINKESPPKKNQFLLEKCQVNNIWHNRFK